MEVPNAAQLSAVCDFNAFDGPGASAGALTQLTTTAGGAVGQGTFTASGCRPGSPDTSLTFGVGGAMRRDAARLAAPARLRQPLTLGAATRP
jgi:hypothetical protein